LRPCRTSYCGDFPEPEENLALRTKINVDVLEGKPLSTAAVKKKARLQDPETQDDRSQENTETQFFSKYREL
jgi:hypothetical protein